jgi:uncharacterized RDD family membrane protein YckC
MGQLKLVAPIWYQQVQFVMGLWIMSEIVVLLTNKKRRAIHDYMAGTVVVQTPAAKTGLCGRMTLKKVVSGGVRSDVSSTR